MPPMLTHFAHLFWRIIHGMPGLVSSNWAAWLLGILAFGLTELLLFQTTPKEERRKRLKVNVGIGIAVTVFVYATVFAWSTVQTTYDDHRDSTGRWQAVVKEKNALKGLLQERDSYIEKLQSDLSTKPNVIEKMKLAPQPKNCWVDTIGQFPNPQTKHAVSVVTLHCNYRVEAPLRISLETNRPLANYHFDFPSNAPLAMMGVVSGTEPGKGFGEDKSVYMDVQGPSFSAERMVVIQVESTTTEAPIPIKGSIDSK